MTTITIQVTHTVEVTLDETKFTPAFMAEFRKDFYNYHTLQEHARNLAWYEAANQIHSDGIIEGYGPIQDMGITLKTTDCETEVVE